MRNVDKFSEQRRWTADESDLSDEVIAFHRTFRNEPNLKYHEVEERFLMSTRTTPSSLVSRVFEKLKQYPHMFEVASARGITNSLNLDGTWSGASSLSSESYQQRVLSLNNFTVRVEDYIEFLETRNVSAGLWEHFLQAFNRCAPISVKLYKGNFARPNRKIEGLSSVFDLACEKDKQILYDCFTHCHKGHLKTIFAIARVATRETIEAPSELHLFQRGEIFDNETQEFENMLKNKYQLEKSVSYVLEKESAHEFHLFLSLAYFCIHGTAEMDTDTIVEAENKALRFCERAVKLAQECGRGSLEYLWSQDTSPRELFESVFALISMLDELHVAKKCFCV